MPTIQIITDRKEIQLNSEWSQVNKIYSASFIVDQNGNKVGSDYQGRQYRIIEKWERPFSSLERFGRGLLGVVAVICTLCFALFSKSTRNLFIQSHDNIRFAIDISAQNETSRTQLRERAPMSEEQIQKIKQILPWVLENKTSKHSREIEIPEKSKEEEDITWHLSQSAHYVFSLNSIPGIIFKLDSPSCSASNDELTMEKRYDNIVRAETIVRNFNLEKLYIPGAQKLDITIGNKTYAVLAEQKVNINPNEGYQEHFFYKKSKELNLAFEQLAVFICQTGYCDVTWRNNPILMSPQPQDSSANYTIALLDLEHMNKPESGLFGTWCTRGLVRCGTKEQATIVLSVAQRCGISTQSFQSALDTRQKEIADWEQRETFYKEHKIENGNEKIELDTQKLDFTDSCTTKDKNSISNVAQLIITNLNKEIDSSETEDAIHSRRYMYIDITDTEGVFWTFTKTIGTDKNVKLSQLEYALKELKRLGLIYNFVDINQNGYQIQA